MSRDIAAPPHGAEIELLKLGVCRAAAMLTDLVGDNVELSLSSRGVGGSRICGGQSDALQSPAAVITQTFAGEIEGRAILSFSAAAGIALAQGLSGRFGVDHAELDSELSGVLLEVGSIVLNGILGSVADALAEDLTYSLPELQTASRKGERLADDVSCGDETFLGDIVFRLAGREIACAAVAICSNKGSRRRLHASMKIECGGGAA